MSYSGVIFDLDGTLIKSEINYLRAWRRAAFKIGVKVTFDLYVELMGLNRIDTIIRLTGLWGSSSKATCVVDESQRQYDGLVAAEGLVLRPGIETLLEHLAAKNRALAVATLIGPEFV